MRSRCGSEVSIMGKKRKNRKKKGPALSSYEISKRRRLAQLNASSRPKELARNKDKILDTV